MMRSVLITGGTGSFGHAFVRRLLGLPITPERICIYSRDEFKQHVMRTEFDGDSRLRWFIGDVRDGRRLAQAAQGCDVIVHAAALKQVPACEYNPDEAIATNIGGAQNVVRAALANGVERAVMLSTDKSSAPVTVYGATKLVAERLFVASNSYAGQGAPKFSCTRYGNVAGSRGSVIPFWRTQIEQGRDVEITVSYATRFWMTQDDAVDLVLLALREMRGGEVFIPKLTSYTLRGLAAAVCNGLAQRETGLRVGEKLHESLISADEAPLARDCGDHYRLLPALHLWRDDEPLPGRPVPAGFAYGSAECLDEYDLKERVARIA